MPVEAEQGASRRAILAAAVGGAAALGAHALAAAPIVRAVDPSLVLNEPNLGTAATTLAADLTGGTVLAVTNSGAGAAVALSGESDVGTGIAGISQTGAAVVADASAGAGTGSGVKARSVSGTGVYATVGATDEAVPSSGSVSNTGGVGIYGFSSVATAGVGVWGDAPTATGLVGTGSVGVLGDSVGVGVLARNLGSGPALSVDGKAHFSRSGKIAIGSGRTSIVKSIPGVTSASMVLAVLQTNRSGVFVRAAVATAGKITIHLNKAPGAKCTIAYLILD